MPVKIKSIGKGFYQVRTPNGVKAKKTSLTNAKKMKRLLQAVEHGWRPTR